MRSSRDRPRRRASHAEILPASRRKRVPTSASLSTIPSELVDLAHLDASAESEMRRGRGHLAGFLVIPRSDEIVAAENLLALGVGTIGDGDAAGSVAQNLAGIVGELLAALMMAVAADAVGPGPLGLHHRHVL